MKVSRELNCKRSKQPIEECKSIKHAMRQDVYSRGVRKRKLSHATYKSALLNCESETPPLSCVRAVSLTLNRSV